MAPKPLLIRNVLVAAHMTWSIKKVVFPVRVADTANAEVFSKAV